MGFGKFYTKKGEYKNFPLPNLPQTKKFGKLPIYRNVTQNPRRLLRNAAPTGAVPLAVADFA